MNAEELAQVLMPVIQEARDRILAIYQSGELATEEKSDHSPVTAADRASHEILVRGLREMTPDIPVVSEEVVGVRPEIQADRMFWLVDPLDGTKEFVRHSDEFTINLALVDSNGVPRFGMLDIPSEGRTFIAGDGRAWVWDGRRRQILSPLHPRNRDAGLVVALSRSHRGQAEEWLSKRGIRVREMVYAGSAIKFAWVAEGRVDLYLRLRPTMGWDTAAGQALLEQVGGTVQTLEGQTLRYQPGAFVNPDFVAAGPLS